MSKTAKAVKKQQSKIVIENSFTKFFLVTSVVIAAIIFAVFLKSLGNQFTNWDDNRYITDNSSITTLHKGNISNSLETIFSSYVAGNYHPLTMLMYSMEYNYFQLNPKPYHLVNVVLHILNSLLVLCFIRLLTKQRGVAFLTALLFGIHPMHVESVVWMSELKDLLYAFFYLSALCAYIFYIQKQNNKTNLYAATFILFILGVLSKAMAVTLPLALFTIDYFLNRPFSKKTVLEKVPFFVVSFVFGFIAIEAQKTLGAIGSDQHRSILEHIIFSSYGLITYLWKLFLPINLSSFYTYPLKENGMYPLIYYVSPLLVLAFLFMVYKLIRFGKDILFGVLFFFITIALVIQLFPVGEALLADRYSYLPYIGLFFILSSRINSLLENENRKNLILTLLIVVAGIFSYLSFQRSIVWKDTLTLWDDAISKSNQASMPFYCRGWEYYQQKKYDKALDDYNNAISLKKNFSDVYYSKGIVYAELGKYDESISNYTLAIQYNPRFTEAYINRGLMYEMLKKYPEALQDYMAAININPQYALAYSNRGNIFYTMGKYDEAIKDYTSAINFNINDLNVLINRGLAFSAIKKYNEAIYDYTKVIETNPNLPLAYYNRGLSYFEMGKYQEAINDYANTIKLNPLFPQVYLNRARVYYTLQQYKLALDDALKVQQLGLAVNPEFIKELYKKLQGKRS